MRSFIYALLLTATFLFGCDDPSEMYDPLDLPTAQFPTITVDELMRESLGIDASFGDHIVLPDDLDERWVGVCSHSMEMFTK